MKIEIPNHLSHLRVSKGLPVPFFAPIINGEPDFKRQHPVKRELCLSEGKCSICGTKLVNGSHYFITGLIGLKNRVVSDAPMHEQCARFSLEHCPHLKYQKTKRRTGDQSDYHIAKKPDTICLIKSDKYERLVHEGHVLIRFRPVSVEYFGYSDNVLRPL